MSNFPQYVFRIPGAQKPIVLRLSKAWDTLKSNQRTITQPEMRRTIGLMETPKVVTIPADHPQYAAILALGETSAAHRQRFEDMNARAKADRHARKLISDIAKVISG